MKKIEMMFGDIRNLCSFGDSLQTSRNEDVEDRIADVGTVGAEQETGGMRLEEVRVVLAEKANAGHMAEVKALIRKRGAVSLSEIDPAEYPALLAEAEKL